MTILITGSSGKTAAPLAKLLHGSHTVLVASRSGTAPAPYAATKFDWHDPSTYANPFESAVALREPISAVYLVAPPGADVVRWMKSFVDVARARGVKRFVLLGSSAVEEGGPLFGEVHSYLKGLGAEWAVLRPSWFMENFSEIRHLPHIRDQGQITAATKDGKVPFISADDIAAVAHRALTDEKSHDTDHLILGSELFTYGEVADLFTQIIGHKVEYIDQTPAEREQALAASGVPADFARILTGLEVGIAGGAEDRMNDVVAQVTGRPPVKFRDFIERNKTLWVRGE